MACEEDDKGAPCAIAQARTLRGAPRARRALEMPSLYNTAGVAISMVSRLTIRLHHHYDDFKSHDGFLKCFIMIGHTSIPTTNYLVIPYFF